MVAQLGGTVTVSSGTSFGSMVERPGDGLVEIRASWTPLEDDLTIHLSLWIEILATLAGLLLFRRASPPWVGVGPPTRDAHQGRALGKPD